MTRLLLIEFAAIDRFHRAVSFPYLQGNARRLGLEVRWLRYAIQAATRAQRGEAGIGLDDHERAGLGEALGAFAPSHILFSARPAEAILEDCERAAPSARLGLLVAEADLARDPPLAALRPVAECDQGIHAFLERPQDEAADAWSAWSARPDYGYEAGNDAARDLQPLPFVHLGTECSYDRPFTAEPFFQDLDLTDCTRHGGCSFCARPPLDLPIRRLSDEEMKDRLAALKETLPPFAGRLSLRLVGEPAVARAEALAEWLPSLGFHDTDLLLDSRADALVRRRGALEGALPDFARSGNRIHLALIGIENFSRDELARFNKGTTPLTNLDAVITLLELEQDHPAAFSFREHGGLSMILFTPWTTRADLIFNLRLADINALDRLSGKALYSRLRLEPGLPLSLKAAQDGLLRERYDDPAFDTAAQNLYEQELPWDFKEPGLDLLCRLLSRFPGTARAPGDRLRPLVDQLLEAARTRGLRPVELALALAEALGEAGTDPRDGEPTDAWARAEALATTVLGRLNAPEASRETDRGETWSGGPDGERGARETDELQALLVAGGLKPVTKIEPIGAEDLKAWQDDERLPNLRLRRRQGQPGAETIYEAFFGPRGDEVEAAVGLTDRLEGAETEAEVQDAMAQVGVLLGYPECCAQAFAESESASGRWSYAWLHLKRRMAIAGAVAPELNPWAAALLAPQIPCALDCEPSLLRARRALELMREGGHGEEAEAIMTAAQNPWLAVLSGQGHAVELVPESAPGERFRFRVGQGDRRSPEIRRLLQADEILLEDERLRLLSKGSLVGDLSARAWIWWHERALQAPFWSRVLQIRDLQASSPSADLPGAARGLGGTTTYGGDPETERLRRGLQRLLNIIVATEGGLAGFGMSPARVEGPGRLRVELSRQDPGSESGSGSGHGDSFSLQIQDARAEAPRLFAVGPFAISLPSDSRLSSEARRALAVLHDRLSIAWRRIIERLAKT